MVATSVALAAVLARRAPTPVRPERLWRMRELARGAAVPIAALALVGALQNVDVIVVRHQVPDGPAGAYAAAAVAAKIVVWTAVGVGLYLLPEAARRAAAATDARPVLLRALGVVAAIAAPALAVFALAPELVLRAGFGEEYTGAASALVLVGLAMSLLGLCYLAVQFLLAVGSTRFLLPLAAVAVAEPILLLAWDVDSITALAAIVLAVQLAAALAMLVPSLRRAPAPATVPVSA
jgi:O-antigen/teichoic acid export membrane protein